MEKKNIIIFEAYPFFSGSQRISLNVCKLLKQQGCKITLLLIDDRYGNIHKNFHSYVDEIRFLNIYKGLLKYGNEDGWFSPKSFPKSLFLGLLPFYLRCIFTFNWLKYDYLYCCDPRGAILMLALARFFKGKCILHFHGKNRLPLYVSKLLLNVYDQVICVSNDVCASLPLSLKKCVIYNGIDFNQYDIINVKEANTYIESLYLSKPLLKFFYAGSIRPQKGLHHLLNAFIEVSSLMKSTNNLNCVLFISGSAKERNEIQFKKILCKNIKDKGFENNIKWLGWNRNILGWMEACDYLLFSSIKKEKNIFPGFGKFIESSEGLPTVLIESSLCKLFAVASDVTGVKDIITDNENGIIYDGTEKGLKDALLYVLTQKIIYKSFPHKAEFSTNTFNEKMLNVFEIRK